jgi:hypothetical protein
MAVPKYQRTEEIITQTVVCVPWFRTHDVGKTDTIAANLQMRNKKGFKVHPLQYSHFADEKTHLTGTVITSTSL